MNIERLMIIPQKDAMSEYERLSYEYGCGFEYNDFCSPVLLDDEILLKEKIKFYNSADIKPPFSTSHGAFYDVNVVSDDPRVREISNLRVLQSIQTAIKLGCMAVVFHTNYIPNFIDNTYRDSWIKKSTAYWGEVLSKYPDINIYIENMFDMDCKLIVRLAENLSQYKNFGICFDYAHANVFGRGCNINEWVLGLAPYVRHIHINDNDLVSDLHLAVGDGRINWELFKNYYEQYFAKASVLLEVSDIEKAKRSINVVLKL